MIYMPDRPYVHVRLRPLKDLFCHACFILLSESSVPPNKGITPVRIQKTGAHDGIRTHDPVLTKNVLYRLSYVGILAVNSLMKRRWWR
jgi:hypothetical protein